MSVLFFDPESYFFKIKIVTLVKLIFSALITSATVPGYSIAKELPIRFLSSDFPLIPGATLEPEFERAIAKEMGRNATHIALSRRRMELDVTKKQVDLVCFIQPTWFGDSAQFYEWTKIPLMSIEYILVGDKATQLVYTFADLKGKRVGTILGYRYQNLEQYFDTSFALREDAPTLESSLDKQLLKRSDYTIMRSFVFHYLKKTDPRYSNLVASPLSISNELVFCGRMKTSDLAQKDLEAAIERLRNRGELKKIIAKYQ